MFIAGVDGCRDGWIVAWERRGFNPVGTQIEVEFAPTFAQILTRDPELVVVDIPIGLLDKGVREADRLARAELGARACCVFNAPLRGILKCQSYQSACAYGERIEGKRISRQTWAIAHKVSEVDGLVTHERQALIREGHPEVSFSLMNKGLSLVDGKRRAAGREIRLRLLESHFLGVRDEVQKRSGVGEDIIDAFAMLWTARRVSNKTAKVFPACSLPDSRGLAMQIWA